MLSRLEYGKRFVRQASPLKPEGAGLGIKFTIITLLPSIALQRCVARSSRTMRDAGWRVGMEIEHDNGIGGCREISPIPGGKRERRASRWVSEDADDRCQQGCNGNLGPSRRALQRRQHVTQGDNSQKETARASAARRAHRQLTPASEASSSRMGMSESASARLERSAAAMSASASRGGSDTDDSLEALDAERVVAARSKRPVLPEAQAVGE